jgi:hypothetical protein
MKTLATIYQEYKQTFFQVVVLVMVLIGVPSVYGWATPTSLPPNENTSAPINVGNVSQVKAGGISAGSFQTDGSVSVGGKIRVGIPGIPTAAELLLEQDVEVGGYVKGRTGLCIGDVCKTAWPESESGVGDLLMDGYAPLPVNSTEDTYVEITSGSNTDGGGFRAVSTDTCDNSAVTQFMCKVDETKVCTDHYEQTCTTNADEYGNTICVAKKRQVTCDIASAYVKVGVSPILFYFKGNVDHELYASLRGTSYTESIETYHGNLVNNNSFYGAGIPTDGAPLRLVQLQGRNPIIIPDGTTRRIDNGPVLPNGQPSSSNNYTVNVYIQDGQPSEDTYEFYITK